MSLTSSQAPARELANRPADERFSSLTAMLQHAQHEKALCREVGYNLRDLTAVVAPDPETQQPALRLQSPRAVAKMTHWSFGQLSRTIGAPASYLRTLPPQLAANCVNHGLKESAEAGTTVNVLARAANGTPEPIIRACTSDSYGRLWDADLIDASQRMVFNAFSRNGHEWKNAPTWSDPVGYAGFRGDRDSFVLQIDGGSIVEDPSARQGDGQMFRGVMLRNSEVGAAGVTLEVCLLRFICGNWVLWGATVGQEYRRRHFGKNVLRDVVRELGDLAYRFTTRTASADEALIRLLMEKELAHTKEAVIDELKKMKLTKEQAESAYARCEQSEKASPRSYWGIAQGITRMSQDETHTDARYVLDQIAAATLARGAKLVHA